VRSRFGIPRAVRALVVVIVAAAGAVYVRAQAPPPRPVFRQGTDLVQVDVSVLDKKRHPVRGLTADNFSIFEDGQPRQIQAFTEVYLPDRVRTQDASWMPKVPRDVVTNQTAREEGRLVIVLLDRTIPLGPPTVTAKRLAAAVINQLGPGDLGAVVSTSNGAVQNLTSDRTRLLRTLDDADLSTDISTDAKDIESEFSGLTGRSWNTFNDGRCLCGICVLDTIARVADAVQGTSGRRKLLFFIGSEMILQTAGSATNVKNDIGCDNPLVDARDAMFRAVDRANLTVHSLDPSGLDNFNPITRASSPLRGALLAAGITAAATDHVQRQGNLRVLPDRTGGRALMNSNDPDLFVPEIFRESDSYYLIGFRPADPSLNGAFHKITVKTSRHGIDVHARSGYTAGATAAPAGDGSAAVSEPVRTALTGLLPANTTAVSMQSATFAVPDARTAAVVLTVGVDAFAGLAAGAALRGAPLEIVASAFDRGGRAKGLARQTLELSWPPSVAAQDRRFDALSRLDLPPGEYEIRVAVSSGAGAPTASVFSYVTVPAFQAAPLSLSDIVLGATAGTLTAPKGFLSSLLPIVPTTRREFARTDRLVAFFRIYQGTNRNDPLAPVQLRSALVDAHDRVITSEADVLDAGAFATARTADHYVTVPLTALAAGEYLLEVETTMGVRTAGRALRFAVK
jgi:VWFA-related protein